MKNFVVAMKKIILFLSVSSTIFMSGVVQAQLEGLTDKNIQQMMQQAKKMDACIKNIDHAALDTLVDRGAKLEGAVAELCGAGGRDQAQRMAMDYIKEVENNKEIAALRACGNMASKMLGSLPLGINTTDKLGDDEHVCDVFADESADDD